jgi:hypothetical protein
MASAPSVTALVDVGQGCWFSPSLELSATLMLVTQAVSF